MSPRPTTSHAIILAAGRARRLGGSLPKALVPVQGEALVGRLCRQLRRRSLSVTVVTGHQADRVETALAGPGVDFVRNPIATTSDLGWSCGVGLAATQASEVLVVLGDTVTHGALFDRLLATPGELVAAWLDVPLDAESMKVRLDGDRPLRFGKDLGPPVAGEFSGVMRLTGRAPGLLLDAILNRDPRRDLMEGPVNAVLPHLDSRAVDCTGLPWIEIDFPHDVQQMHNLFPSTQPTSTP